MSVELMTTINTEHEDMIHDAQMDYYAHKLATCSSDKTVKVYEVVGDTFKPFAQLSGHDGPVWQVAWGHPMHGSLLASCSYDRKVIVWKETGNNYQQIYQEQNHDSSVNSICWAPHEFGPMLACGASDGAVSIISYVDGQWELEKILNAHSCIGCNAVSWMPAVQHQKTDPITNTTTYHYTKKIVSGGCDNLVKIWAYSDTENKWVEEDQLSAHSDWVRDVACAPNCGSGNIVLASCSLDCRVIIWRKKEGEQWKHEVLHKFEEAVWHVSWSMAGGILAVSGADNKVSLWKETLDGTWQCVSDVTKGQGISPTQ